MGLVGWGWRRWCLWVGSMFVLFWEMGRGIGAGFTRVSVSEKTAICFPVIDPCVWEVCSWDWCVSLRVDMVAGLVCACNRKCEKAKSL